MSQVNCHRRLSDAAHGLPNGWPYLSSPVRELWVFPFIPFHSNLSSYSNDSEVCPDARHFRCLHQPWNCVHLEERPHQLRGLSQGVHELAAVRPGGPVAVQHRLQVQHRWGPRWPLCPHRTHGSPSFWNRLSESDSSLSPKDIHDFMNLFKKRGGGGAQRGARPSVSALGSAAACSMRLLRALVIYIKMDGAGRGVEGERDVWRERRMEMYGDVALELEGRWASCRWETGSQPGCYWQQGEGRLGFIRSSTRNRTRQDWPIWIWCARFAP